MQMPYVMDNRGSGCRMKWWLLVVFNEFASSRLLSIEKEIMKRLF